MASPIFDDYSMRLAKGIADPVATAATNGTILTALSRDEYVNKAMMELIRKYWELVKGDIESFIDLFPELVGTDSITTDANGIYAITSTKIRDFFKIINATKSTTYIKTLPKHLFTVIKTSRFDDMAPDSDNPVVIEIDKSLYFFPAADFNAKAVSVYYLKMPLNPTDGTALTNAGTYDSPFYSIWGEEIVNTAIEIFRKDTQRG